MSLSEKAAYIKGLMDGMELDTTKKEGKILSAMQELLAEMAGTVETLEGDLDQVYEELDAIDEDMDDIEEVLFSDEDEEDEDQEDEDEEEDLHDLYDYELTCPKCGTVTAVDEETLMNEQICCPECGADFDIRFEGDEDEEEDPEK